MLHQRYIKATPIIAKFTGLNPDVKTFKLKHLRSWSNENHCISMKIVGGHNHYGKKIQYESRVSA